jgi:hypothetical protein
MLLPVIRLERPAIMAAEPGDAVSRSRVPSSGRRFSPKNSASFRAATQPAEVAGLNRRRFCREPAGRQGPMRFARGDPGRGPGDLTKR